jgi:predicted AlkP superfamily pyrophosphatase or phosphodiesterase
MAIGQSRPKVVFVIADGIPADVIERLRPHAMQEIIQKGGYKRAYVGGIAGTYKETPTISAPGYNNLLTGTWAYKHNVWDNENQHPNYNYPSLFRVLKSQKKESTTAIFSTWVENRKTLLGEGLAETQNLSIDFVCDGYEKDTLRFPHDTAGHYLHLIDEYVVHCADSVIRKNGPDLSWVYLEYTDDVGHNVGTGKEFDSAVGLLDQQLKKIRSAIRYREMNYKEKWLLLVTTDHGRDSITGAEHGDQSKRERTTWIIHNQPQTNAYWASAEPAIVDIFPSIANFLNIQLPTAVSDEIDGTPFLGPVSVTGAILENKGDRLTVHWKSFSQDEKINIYISYTDQVKSGGKDNYHLLGTVDAKAESFTHEIHQLAMQPFYKIVLRGKYNSLQVRHIIGY